MYVSSASALIYKYDENFNFVSTMNYSPEVFHIDGWIFQCDGSKILADRSGKVIFVDKDDNVVQVYTAGFFRPVDVAITKNGALFVSDVGARKVLCFSNYGLDVFEFLIVEANYVSDEGLSSIIICAHFHF